MLFSVLHGIVVLSIAKAVNHIIIFCFKSMCVMLWFTLLLFGSWLITL